MQFGRRRSIRFILRVILIFLVNYYTGIRSYSYSISVALLRAAQFGVSGRVITRKLSVI